jgi:conjugative transfer signal peptidase TraF
MMPPRSLSIGLASLLAIGAVVTPRQHAVLIWNATASTPIGLYALRPSQQLRAMDLVAIRPPARIARFLADEGYLPRGALLLKHVLALAGQTVCRFDHRILVDGAVESEAKDRDHLNRPLPVWTGCRTLSPGQIFVLNPSVPDSLDGRYFGPLPISSVVGRAMPLWTDDGSSSRFRWRASAR